MSIDDIVFVVSVRVMTGFKSDYLFQWRFEALFNKATKVRDFLLGRFFRTVRVVITSPDDEGRSKPFGNFASQYELHTPFPMADTN